jgi:hypothetical protein
MYEVVGAGEVQRDLRASIFAHIIHMQVWTSRKWRSQLWGRSQVKELKLTQA